MKRSLAVAMLLAVLAPGAASAAGPVLNSQGVPDNTGHYVHFCADKANYVNCANYSLMAGHMTTMEIGLYGSSAHCELPRGITTEGAYAKIIAWLIAHPETHGIKTLNGLLAATDAIWPCR